jgi:phage portal protein BeeE
MSIITSTFNAVGSFFSRGKDQFTQTKYGYFNQLFNIGKGEVWIDNSVGELYNIYDTTPQLKAVINRKASMVANGRWQHYKNGKLVENSDVVRLLENPSPINNGNELLRNESISYDIYGNSFYYLLRGSSLALPKCIYILPSEKVVIDKSGLIYNQTEIDKIIKKVKIVNDDGAEQVFELKDLIHLKNSAVSDPIIGSSNIKSLTMPISNVRASYGFRNRIITNDAALGILSSDTKDGLGITLDNSEQTRLNKGYRSSFGMQSGKNNIQMTEASVKWSAMSYPTKDLMLFEEIDQNFKIIIDTFGLNENIFSKPSGSTYENLKQGIKLAYQDCIIPFAEDRALAFTKALELNGVDEWLSIDYSHLEILKEDEQIKASTIKTKAEAIQILTQLGREDLVSSIEM